MYLLPGWLLTAFFSIPLRLRPSGSVATGSSRRSTVKGSPLSFLTYNVAFSTSVRDLGAMLDSELTFSHHINLIARKCYYQLRQLRAVSRSLTHQSRLTLVHAFVTSPIDRCCSLLAGLPLGILARLDRVLRSAAPACWRAVQVFFHHCLHA